MNPKNPPRFQLYCLLRYKHGVRLSPNQMDAIEQFYHENIKGSIFHVGMYRVINFIFAILMLAGMVLFWKQTETVRWFMVVTMVAFAIYNVIHLFINIFQYKTIQEPKEFQEPQETKDGGN